PRAGMESGVMQSPRYAVLSAHHEDRLVADLERTKAARLGHIARTADVYPVPVPHLAELPQVLGRIEIVGGGGGHAGGGQPQVARVPPDGGRIGTHVCTLATIVSEPRMRIARQR